ncbi:LOW QUALITY PROTEIN: coiled-coil domain-containing protein 137 [Meleagris gallopavo]|uniref:LOW QUALITY PROTEIN: coiled-coil domain-containing protein 137 n=1 Tax=Meleagris gallopavo TaxID=9103 RepID=UPI000549BF5A|nr:LOW QUALITY PROTEIN: coiled-coil domain-containing protein 137 [Meleagris gallopavo]
MRVRQRSRANRKREAERRRRRATGSGGSRGSGERVGSSGAMGLGRKKGQGPGPGPGKGKRKGQGLRPGHGKEQGPAPGKGPAAATPRGRKEKALVNLKPKHPDEQEIPFRLRELMQSREAMKHPKARARRAAEKPQRPQGTEAQEDIPVPRFRRRRGESERSYVCRMEREVQHVLVLSKNQVQREPEKEAAAPQKSQRKKEFQNKKLDKLRKKKEEKKEALLEKSLFQDPVAFGEVVTEPPTITSRPRSGGPTEKAGRKRLLLTPHLGQSRAAPTVPVSLARQRIVQEERARVIQAYRDIQRRKQQQRDAARGGTQPSSGVPG